MLLLSSKVAAVPPHGIRCGGFLVVTTGLRGGPIEDRTATIKE
jgi:hypothetical protein